MCIEKWLLDSFVHSTFDVSALQLVILMCVIVSIFVCYNSKAKQNRFLTSLYVQCVFICWSWHWLSYLHWNLHCLIIICTCCYHVSIVFGAFTLFKHCWRHYVLGLSIRACVSPCILVSTISYEPFYNFGTLWDKIWTDQVFRSKVKGVRSPVVGRNPLLMPFSHQRTLNNYIEKENW